MRKKRTYINDLYISVTKTKYGIIERDNAALLCRTSVMWHRHTDTICIWVGRGNPLICARMRC